MPGVCLFVPVSDTLDSAFGEDGDSEEEDAIVNQVLDEIGISLNERVRSIRFFFFVSLNRR